MHNLVHATFDHLKSSNIDADIPPTSLMPTFADLFPVHGEPVPPLPPIKYDLDDVTMIMHSSGKPLPAQISGGIYP